MKKSDKCLVGVPMG